MTDRARWMPWLVGLACVVACAALTIALDQGVWVGAENHSGLLPVVRRLLDPAYLPGDFGISLREHHHRVFALAVAALARTGLGETGALVVLTWLGYLAIFGATWRLAGALGLTVERRVLACVAIATGFAYLDRGVEANRLLGNGPIMPPTFAHAFALMSLVALVRRRFNLALAWAGAVALIHLQIGAAWLIVVAIVIATRREAWPWRRWLPGLAAGLVIASPSLVDLVALFQAGLADRIADTSDVAFRMPQHFEIYPGRLAIVIVYLVGMLALWRRWRRRDGDDARVARFVPLAVVAVAIVAMTLVHYLDYYVLHTGWIARMQLLRLSMFVPVLGALAIIAALPAWEARRGAFVRHAGAIAAAAMIVVAVGNALAKGEHFSLRLRDESLADNDWAAICRAIRAQGPAGLYASPPGRQGFGTFAHRSTLVEFKINPDGGAGLDEWQARLLALSGGAFPAVTGRRQMADALDAAYARLTRADFVALRERYGVDYALVPDASPLTGRVVLDGPGYRVVSLRD